MGSIPSTVWISLSSAATGTGPPPPGCFVTGRFTSGRGYSERGEAMERARDSFARDVALWTGVLGAPAIWSLQFLLNYALAPWSCPNRQIVLHLVTVVGLLLAIVGTLLSWGQWKRAGDVAPHHDEGGPFGRSRFLGALGIVVGAMFAVLILAQGLPAFFFDPCWN